MGKDIQRSGKQIAKLGTHQNLVEHGSFIATIEGTGQMQTAQTPIFKESVLNAVDCPGNLDWYHAVEIPVLVYERLPL